MCFQGESTATIKNPTAPEPDASGKRPDWFSLTEQSNIEKGRADVAQRRKQQGIPDDAPDFTDTLLSEARKRMAGQLLTKGSRRQALSNNPGSYSLL